MAINLEPATSMLDKLAGKFGNCVRLWFVIDPEAVDVTMALSLKCNPFERSIIGY